MATASNVSSDDEHCTYVAQRIAMFQPRPSLSGTKRCTIAIYYATGNVRHHYCALITVHLMQIFVVKTLYYCNLLCYVKCTITVCTQSQLERRVREGHNKTRPYVHTYIRTYVHTSSWPAYTVLHEGHKENKVNALDDHTDGSCCRDHC